MTLHIKNMVCNRCIVAVTRICKATAIVPEVVELGMVITKDDVITEEMIIPLREMLMQEGFELLDDRKSKLISQIKNIVINIIHHNTEIPNKNYSSILSENLNSDYAKLSQLFSGQEGITIEQYVLLQKAEKVKELLTYNQLNVQEIADKMGYSSAAHLSSQFRKVTGMSPSAFRKGQSSPRRALDTI